MSRLRICEIKIWGLTAIIWCICGWKVQLSGQYEAFRRELLQQPGIVGVTSTAHNPSRVTVTGQMPCGRVEIPVQNIFSTGYSNYDVVNTLQMELVHGREFLGFSRRSQKFYRE